MDRSGWSTITGGGRDTLAHYADRIFSPETLALGQQYDINAINQVAGYAGDFVRTAGGFPGDSRDFQRGLYRMLAGRDAPEAYSGFHASQADRIQNVFSPDSVNIDAMRIAAFIATLMREMENAGYSSPSMFYNLQARDMYEENWRDNQPAPDGGSFDMNQLLQLLSQMLGQGGRPA